MAFSLISVALRIVYMFLRVEDKNSFPEPLAKEEEEKCFRLMKEGDEKAREKLILHNLRLAAHIVKKYGVGEKNQEDLLSVSTIGLIKAIDSYNIDGGTRFATYAGKCMQNEILMYYRAQKKIRNEVSINETIDIDKDGNPLTFEDIISSDDCIADNLFIRVSSEKMRKIIKEKLTERERKIIYERYGLSGDKPKTQRDIAEEMGISRSYVSRIEKSALDKLANEMK